jgi:hypothetical protein
MELMKTKALYTLLVLLAAFPAQAEITLTHLGNVRCAKDGANWPTYFQPIAAVPGATDRLYVGWNPTNKPLDRRAVGVMSLPTPSMGPLINAPLATWLTPLTPVGVEYRTQVIATNPTSSHWAELRGMASQGDKLCLNFGKHYYVDSSMYRNFGTVNLDLTNESPLVGPTYRDKAGWLAAIPECWIGPGYMIRGSHWTNSTDGGPSMEVFQVQTNGPTVGKWSAKYQVVFKGTGVDATKSHLVDGWTRHDWWKAAFCCERKIPFQPSEKFVVVLGTVGKEPIWYGEQTLPDGTKDECSAAKGWHADKYVAEAWVYRWDDLLKVLNGTASTWWPQPVQKIPLDGFGGCGRVMGAAMLDDGRFVVGEERAYQADKYTWANVLRVYQVGF